MKRTRWFQRKFNKIDDNGLMPSIIERLEGTPVRLKAKIQGHQENLLIATSNNKWSVKQEIGHLGDLELLWLERIENIINEENVMREADLTNRKTHDADHNSMPIKELLSKFELQRISLIGKLKALSSDDQNKSSLHSRLNTPMNIVDLCYFVAEHDDHHLAKISTLLNDYIEN